uniref:ATP synthase F0 subunit 8 n=1 Tax=Chauliops quaternaria TaxID=2936723 RepID=UPI0030DFB444
MPQMSPMSWEILFTMFIMMYMMMNMMMYWMKKNKINQKSTNSKMSIMKWKW